MPLFNRQAFGQTVYVNFNQDISTATQFEMELQPQFTGQNFENDQDERRARLIVTPILGTVDVKVDDQLFLANEYVEYVTKENDFRDDGRWRKKAKAVLVSETIVTNYTFFRIMP